MKKNPMIVTNNPKVRSFFEDLKYPVIFIEGGYGDVLDELRKKVHLNYELLTHPLSGSIKPNETPYKSVGIHKGDTLDMLSLELISNAVEVYERLQNDLKTPLWTENILDDFMVIDLDLIKNALI
ncbi:MAG: GrdX family protein [Peptostreptococcaceae bacterium]|nr:GrdX family protein [Peptostreptococcaceae bacterium]